MHARAELIGERVRAFDRPVRQMHVFDAALDQAEYHRARSTSASVALSHPLAQASRLLIKPSTSVLVARNSPASYHSVLAAPTARARASGVDSVSARSLCGRVTLAPTKPCVDKRRTKTAKSSGGTASIT